MRITDVRACVIGRPEPHSGGCVWTFVRVYTDEGIVGTGECSSAAAGTSGFAVKEAVLAMKRHLIDKDPTNPGPLCEPLRRQGRYGDTTTASLISALTGIETGLNDTTGKSPGRASAQASRGQALQQDTPLCESLRWGG